MAFPFDHRWTQGAGHDINGGILAELAGVDRLLVLAGRYVLLVAGSAAAVPLFLGGGAGPLLPSVAVGCWPRSLVLSVLLIALSRRLPTLRPDKLLELGWVVVLPSRGGPGPRRLDHRGRNRLALYQTRKVNVVSVALAAVAFWLCAVVSVVAGALVFYVDSMARATYALAVSFVAVGISLLLLGQAYMGVIVVLMMVMEMAVMAVYMVMFMGMNPALMPMSMVHSHRSAILAAIGTFLLLGLGAVLVPWPAYGAELPPIDVTGNLGAGAHGVAHARHDRDGPGDGRHHCRRRRVVLTPRPLRPSR